MRYRFGDYWKYSKTGIITKLQEQLNLLNFKDVDANLVYMLVDSHIHALKNRTIYTKRDGTWIEQTMIDTTCHNPLDLVSLAKLIKLFDLEWQKSHSQTTTAPYDVADNNNGNGQIASDGISFHKGAGLLNAVNAMQIKNRYLDRVYHDLELLCLPMISNQDTEPFDIIDKE